MADPTPDDSEPLRPTTPRKTYGGLNTDITEGTDAIGGSAAERDPEKEELKDEVETLRDELETLKEIIYGPGGPGSGGGLQGLADALGSGGAMEGAGVTTVEACKDGEAITLTIFAKESPAA